MGRSRLVLVFGILLASRASLWPQVPPQALQALKPVVTKAVEKLLKPRMQVESFFLGGIKATRVVPDADATPEAFSGSALFDLPAPLEPRTLTFKGLVLKGNTAEGTLDAALRDVSTVHQAWTYHLTRVVLSNQGNRVEGTATLAGLKLDLGPLTLTPQGLTGTLGPQDLPLAVGAFTATLQAGSAVFSPQGVRLEGHLLVAIAPPVRDGLTGEAIQLDGGTRTFDSALLAGTGTVAPDLASNLSLLHKGHTWRVQTLAFAFERATPVLSGPVCLEFPLNVFCTVGATDQPYRTGLLPCSIRAQAPAPPAQAVRGVSGLPGSARIATAPPLVLGQGGGWEGFSGSFPLPAATLIPSGLTAYRLAVDHGVVQVDKGQLEPGGTRLTGRLSWGPGFAQSVVFTDTEASLSDGLYACSGPLQAPATVGAYQVLAPQVQLLCDFSTAQSPHGLPGPWMGVFVPAYGLALPQEIFTFNTSWQRLAVVVASQDGRFEGDGSFSGSVSVALSDPINLHIAPVQLDPFELHFLDGALLEGPVVKGQLEMTVPGLLKDFKAPIQFHLTQNGAEQIEVNTQTPQGPMAIPSNLVGIIMVMDSARLNPTNMDFTGRFDFNIAGALLPSVPFDHLVLEASGAGIDGSTGPLSLALKGSRWSDVAGQPDVTLWGFPMSLGEAGYGVESDGRFYVGLGGNIEINPILPTLYNRMLFTTDPKNSSEGTLELEKPYSVDQSVASLGSFQAQVGFHVETANDQVSDAYFLGDGALKVNIGDAPFSLQAGLRFGRSYQGGSSFPYFFALGHFEAPSNGIPVSPDLEIYGLAGGLAQNFLPDNIRDTEHIKGKPDASLGIAVMAGVDVGTSDQFTFHGDLDLYISQNLTTLLQGKGWLFCSRKDEPSDNQVSADLRFTRNPDAFHATLAADLSLCGGALRPIGQVEMLFSPDKKFVHVGTKDAPIRVKFLSAFEGSGYITADFAHGAATFGAGGAVSYSKNGNFGILWGNAYLNAHGDLLITIDADKNPHFLGTLGAEGGASFGMEFDTFWHDYKITIFSGSIAANLAFQAPGSPTLSGAVTIHYSVLGGAFSGSVDAHMDM
jgi:hypothetical protein